MNPDMIQGCFGPECARFLIEQMVAAVSKEIEAGEAASTQWGLR